MKMRTEQEVMDLILSVANADERIRGVMLAGSRADSSVPKDQYQDYDIGFAVTDMKPFYNNPAWAEDKFGKPLIMQMPENLRGAEGDGNFIYLMIFPDGVRIDLSFIFEKYVDDGEPVKLLLDKDNGDGFFPLIKVNEKHWHVKPPTSLDYYSSFNNFWWCLNNVARGIMRDELPYVMSMINDAVRPNLHDMINWYIGTQFGFNCAVGKYGKYYKKYLSPQLYSQYCATYSNSDYDKIWLAIDTMCEIFSQLAPTVAKQLGFLYHKNEEDGMRIYLNMIRSRELET